jgi:response regulator RpfG family c-di-GMP phosphodiesterase
MDYTLRAILEHIGERIHGAVVSSRVRLSYGEALREARVLGAHLEETVFPPLHEARVLWATIRIPPDRNQLLFESAGSFEAHPLPGTAALHASLANLNIRTLRLDTRLEGNQLEDAILLLLHAAPEASEASPMEEAYPEGWNPRKMAGAMLGDEGLHRYCGLMRLRPDPGRFEIEYSYCELAYSRAIGDLIKHWSHSGDHRALFHAAPRAAAAVGLFGSLTLILLYAWPAAGYALAVLLLIVGAAGAGYGIFALGSMRYDREHRDSLLQESTREIQALAHFPQANPDPVLKLDAEGQLLYRNPATARLLDELGLPADRIEEILPPDAAEHHAHCLHAPEGAPPIRVEAERHGRVFQYVVSRFPGEASCLITASDITRRKELEDELREVNATLERRVEERTREVRLVQEGTVLSLTGLAETRDPETGAHIDRTRLYVRALAGHLAGEPGYDELDAERIEMLYQCAPLHDIGKVGVPDDILLKPGRLTDGEFEIMKTHARMGADALRRAAARLGEHSFLRIATEIAESHHEKWDGSGYPDGLAGEAIPLSGRLMAVADVYDALISKRVYKPAFSHEKAKGILLDGKGSHFDPALIEAFLACEEAFVRIAGEHADPEEPETAEAAVREE